MTVVAVEFDPIRDKTYRRARLGPDVAAFLAWYELGGASEATVDNAERSLAALCRLYPLTPLAGVTDGQLAQLFKRWPPRGRRTRVAPVRQFFRWAVTTRRIDRAANPMDTLPEIRKPPRKQPEVFTEAEVAALLDLPVHDAAPLGLLFLAGLRREEAIHVQLKHCRPSAAAVRVVKAKGGKQRLVRMDGRLALLLADLELLEGVNDDDYILYRTYANAVTSKRMRDKPVGEGTFSRWWHRCLDDAGVRHRNPHVARHTFATAWRRRGLALDDLAIQLGHVTADGAPNVKVTSEFYAQRTFEDSALAMALIEAGETE